MKLLKSFAYAFRGVYLTFKSERNFRIHVSALVLAVTLGLYLGLSAPEWGLIIFAIGFVLASELFNTAIERLGNEASGGKPSQVVRNIKDISSAAVLLSAMTALAIRIIILIIPLVQRMV